MTLLIDAAIIGQLRLIKYSEQALTEWDDSLMNIIQCPHCDMTSVQFLHSEELEVFLYLIEENIAVALPRRQPPMPV